MIDGSPRAQTVIYCPLLIYRLLQGTPGEGSATRGGGGALTECMTVTLELGELYWCICLRIVNFWMGKYWTDPVRTLTNRRGTHILQDHWYKRILCMGL